MDPRRVRLILALAACTADALAPVDDPTTPPHDTADTPPTPPPLRWTDRTPPEVPASPSWLTPFGVRPSLPVSVGDPTGACRVACADVCEVPPCTHSVWFAVSDGASVGLGYRLAPDGAWTAHGGPTLSAAGALDHPTAPYVAHLGLLDVDGDGRDELLAGGVLSRWTDGGWSPDPGWPDKGGCVFLPAREGLGVLDLDRDGWLDTLSSAAEGGTDCGVGPLYGQLATPHGWTRFDGFLGASARQDLYSVLLRHLPDGRLQLAAWGRAIPDPSPAYSAVWLERPGGDKPTFELQDPGVGDLTAHHPMGGDWCATRAGDTWTTRVLAAPIGARLRAFDATDPLQWWDTSQALGAITPWEHPWGTVCTDLDKDGRWDILSNAGPNSAMGTSPDTRPMAWWRPDDDGAAVAWPSEDLGDLGVARAYPWGRGLGLMDVDHDGDLDLLDGAAEGDGRPRLLINDTPGRSLTVQLRGTLTNPLGVGALVDAELPDGRTLRRHLGGAWQPGVLVRPQAEFGLGPHEAAVVTVRWPDGTVQQAGELRAGALWEVVQPPWLTLHEDGAPSDRRVPAGGELQATACAFRPDGTPAAAPSLRLEDILGVVPTLTDNGPDSAGCRRWSLRATGGPGTVRIAVIQEDGAALTVRPRVWFDGT